MQEKNEMSARFCIISIACFSAFLIVDAHTSNVQLFLASILQLNVTRQCSLFLFIFI